MKPFEWKVGVEAIWTPLHPTLSGDATPCRMTGYSQARGLPPPPSRTRLEDVSRMRDATRLGGVFDRGLPERANLGGRSRVRPASGRIGPSGGG